MARGISSNGMDLRAYLGDVSGEPIRWWVYALGILIGPVLLIAGVIVAVFY